MRLFITLALVSCLGGCASTTPLRPTAELSVVEADSLPAPDSADVTSQRAMAFVGPLDRLVVDVFGIEDLSREVQTDAANRFSLPLVGTVDASGRTAPELAEEIRTKLQPFVRDPKVAVNIKNEEADSSFVVTVDGQVKEPGLYPVGGKMTLMRAVAAAKGPSDTAALDDVVILRTSGGRRMAGLYSLEAIRRGVYADPTIYPDDVVVVGDSPTRRLFNTLIAVSPVLAAPVIAVLQR